jgi:hypothetical protein
MREAIEISHVGFDADNLENHAVCVTNFDFDAVDEALGFIHQAPPPVREQAAELFRALASWCFRGNRPLRCGMVKFVAIVAGLRPEILQDRSGQDLSTELGITKQALTHQSLRFADAWGFHFARSRSKEGRERMAAARRGGPNRNLGANKKKAQNEATRSHHAA